MKRKRKLTSFILYKFPDSFRMMDIAVIEDKNTPWSWVRICKWYLTKET